MVWLIVAVVLALLVFLFLIVDFFSPGNVRLSNFASSPKVAFQTLPNTQKFGVYNSTACDGCGPDLVAPSDWGKIQNEIPASVQNGFHGFFAENNHLFSRDGTNLPIAFSSDDKVYYEAPAIVGFSLMQLDADTGRTRQIAYFYVGDYLVPNLRIDSISIAPDNQKIAVDLTSDSITLFGDSFHDLVVLDMGANGTKVYDLGNAVAYGGWWNTSSSLFYFGCPIPEHSDPNDNEVCAVQL